MARATLAPVIGRPASCSQKMVWRYSSSATVAWARRTWSDPNPCPRAPRRAFGQRHERARGGREMRVAAGDEGECVDTAAGRSETSCSRRAQARPSVDARGRSCRRARAARGRARRSMYSTSIAARASRPPAARARAAGGASGRRSPARVVEDQRRLGEPLDRHRLAHALGVGGEVEQLLVGAPGARRARGRRPGARSGRPRAGRRARRRRPRRSSGRSAARARPGSACGSPGRGRRAGSEARCRTCRTRRAAGRARAPRARTRRASWASASVRSACGRSSRPASVSSSPRPARANSGDAELGLQPADLLGQARLGHVQGLRGRRERAVVGRGEEVGRAVAVSRLYLSTRSQSSLQQWRTKSDNGRMITLIAITGGLIGGRRTRQQVRGGYPPRLRRAPSALLAPRDPHITSGASPA